MTLTTRLGTTLGIAAALLLTGCATASPGGDTTTTAAPQASETGSTPAVTPPDASAPTPTAAASPVHKAYDSCAAYAAAHQDGTLNPYTDAITVITTNTGSSALDLSITTPEGTKAYYLCELPGYPDDLTVSQAAPHDAG